MDYLLWSYLKTKIDYNRSENIEALKDRIWQNPENVQQMFSLDAVKGQQF